MPPTRNRQPLPHYIASPGKRSWHQLKSPNKLLLALILILLYLLYNARKGEAPTAPPTPMMIPWTATNSPGNEDTRFAIVSFVTSEKSYIHMSLENKYAYAKKHNYTLALDFRADVKVRGIMWYKFIMVERLILEGKHDWIWWIDFDTLITNGDIKLDDIVQEALANATNPDDINLLLTADCFALNAGSMLFRSNKSTLDFLNRVRAYGTQHENLSEQDCIRDLLRQDSQTTADSSGKVLGWCDQHTKFIPQKAMNAFPQEIKCWDSPQGYWEPGAFVIHFAGAWAHVKEEDATGYLMRKYQSQVRNLF